MVGVEAGPVVTAGDGKVVALGLEVTPARNALRVATAEARAGKGRVATVFRWCFGTHFEHFERYTSADSGANVKNASTKLRTCDALIVSRVATEVMKGSGPGSNRAPGFYRGLACCLG